MNRKICPHCKTDNPAAAIFCKKCGALFRGTPITKKEKTEEDNNRKNIIVTAVCIVLLILAFIVFKSGSAPKQTNVTTAAPETTLSEVVTTTAPTTLPTTVATTAEITTTKATPTLPTLPPSTTAAPTTAKALSTEDAAEICKKYNALISELKANQGSLSVHKTEDISLEITSFSLPVDTDTLNRFMSNLIPKTNQTVNFSGGASTGLPAVKLSSYIPPSTASAASVSAENLKAAAMDTNGTITLSFKADYSSFDNGETVFPSHVASATEVVDFSNFVLGPVSIFSAEMDYPSTVIKAEVDTNGRLKKLTITQPVELTSTGGVGSFTADVGLKLGATTVYEISY